MSWSFLRTDWLEDLLAEDLGSPSAVDGHDFGSGEFNIFILTDQPRESFSAVEKTIQHYRAAYKLKAAYREIGQDKFVILWPPNLQHFDTA